MKKFIILCLFSVFSTNAIAEIQSGNVIGYIPYHTAGKKIFIFKLENNVVEGCNATGRYSFDETHPNYDVMVSTIMTAFHTNNSIKVSYAQSCTAWVNSYDAIFVCVGSVNC